MGSYRHGAVHSADHVRNASKQPSCRLAGLCTMRTLHLLYNGIDHARMANDSQNTLMIDRQLYEVAKTVPFFHFSTYHGIKLAAMPLFTAMLQRTATQYVVP
jgi:hypothetical protein